MTSSRQPPWLHRYLTEYLTLDEVGELEGVTREGVRHRLQRIGIKPRTASETRRRRESHKIDLHSDPIRRRFLEARDVGETAQALGLPVSLVERAVAELVPDYQILARAPRKSGKKYSAADLVSSLVDAAESSPGNLTTTGYDDFVATSPTLLDGRPRPGKQVMMLRFGSWRDALARAELPANPHSGPDKSFDEADAIAAVTECWRQTGQPPTAASYDVWQRGHRGRPSMATVRNRAGSWNPLLVRSWQLVHGILLDQDDEDAVVPPALLTASGNAPDSQWFVPYVAADEGVAVSSSADLVAAEYNALERAVRSHAAIQNAVAAATTAAGMDVWSPTGHGPAFDVAFTVSNNHVLLVEVKSSTIENLELQLRIGLGQILRYSHQLRSESLRVTPMIAIELRPDETWTGLLRELGVELLVYDSIDRDLAGVLKQLHASYAAGVNR